MIEYIIILTVGLVVGMYITTQIKESICSNINEKELKKNLEEYEKKKTKQ
jgi:uncharacterized protein YneF (UPF0154 family)